MARAKPRREPVGPAQFTAPKVAKIRDRLVRLWASELAFRGMTDEAVFPGVDAGADTLAVALTPPVPAAVASGFVARMRQATTVASLYWVSPQFTALARHAGDHLPDLILQRSEVPDTSGFVVFAEPVMQVDRPDGGPGKASIVAVSWLTLPRGIWVVMYVRPEQVFGDAPVDSVRAAAGYLLPISSGGCLPFGTAVAREDLDGLPGHATWRTLLATWFLIRSPGVAQVGEAAAERDFERSYARRHNGARPPAVKVVDIRPRASRRRDEAHGGGRKLTVRSLVGMLSGGFWRWQPKGPGRVDRELIWIMPFERGPQDAPFAHERDAEVPVVRALR